ncbi:MAG: hypothetical protein SGARI_000484 [Bacillariaceae sp.]
MQEMVGPTADQSSSEHSNGAAIAAAGNSKSHDEKEILKGKINTAELNRLRDQSLQQNLYIEQLEKDNAFLAKLLKQNLEKGGLSSAEESDEETESEDQVSQELPPMVRTLKTENIFATFGAKGMLIPRGVEDSLFERPPTDKAGLVQILLASPLQSYLLSMDSDTYTLNIEHMYEQLTASATQLQSWEQNRDRLQDLEIPTVINALATCNSKVTNLYQKLSALEAEIETYENEVASKEAEKEELQNEKECAIASIERIQKAAEVATLLKDMMEEIVLFHRDPDRRQSLPLGSITSATDPNLIGFKEKCGLTDYASTQHLSTRKHLCIARAAKILGIEYSPYYTNGRFPSIVVGKHAGTPRLQEQTCRILGIEKEVDVSGETHSRKGPSKRKAARESTPAKKKSKPDDSAMEQFVSTPGGRDAVMKNPALQEMVQASPALQLAFLAGATSSGDDSESSAEQA